MAGSLHDRISALENQIVALGKVQQKQLMELEELKKLAANPAPQIRKNAKEERVRRYDTFYLNRRLKQQAS